MAKKKKPAKQTKRSSSTAKSIYPLTPAGSIRGRPSSSDLGMKSFAFHSFDAPDVARGLAPPAPFAAVEASADATKHLPDAETAARQYLSGALASPSLPALTAAEVGGQSSEFSCLGVESIPFTGTDTVKFRQTYHQIPVYGSLVNVELDAARGLVSISSSLGDPTNVDPIARVSPHEVLQTVRRLAGYAEGETLSKTPRLFFYYDDAALRWRLVYIVEDVVKRRSEVTPVDRSGGAAEEPQHAVPPEMADFVIDAHSGELIRELPRTMSVETRTVEQAKDELGKSQQIGVLSDGNGAKQMFDTELNVITHDFEFKSVDFAIDARPGKLISNPPAPWPAGAVSAHANATRVAQFLRQVLMRNGLDNQGGRLIASINCVEGRASPQNRELRNAFWFLGQMFYGQRRVGNRLRSYAAALDVVAHEIIHGLTEATARLEYVTQSGALNESYSDIFGVIISNADRANIDNWNWEMGEDLSGTGIPIRDLSRPSRFNQPEHMDDFLTAIPPYTRFNDYGHVHTNSGIPNKAAFNIITAKNGSGDYLFTPTDVARLFYLALTQRLSRRSQFIDSRNALVLSAKSLFAQDPMKQEKVDAVNRGFDEVGITQ
jgi:Zn-dependent metalloprotease